MKVILLVFLSSILVFTESKPKKTKVAVETVLEFNKKNKGIVDVDFLDGVQDLLDKVKKAIRTRTPTNSYERLKFTDFLENAIVILKTYNDEDLQKVFDILDDEIHKYHYEGCKFHELTEKYAIRRFMSDKLDEVKKAPPDKIRKGLDKALKSLRERKYDDVQSEAMKLLNSVYGKDSTIKLATFLNNLQQYQANTRRTYLDLLSVVKTGLRSVVFDHYSNLNSNIRKELKLKLESYWTDELNHKINHRVIQIGGSTENKMEIRDKKPEKSVRYISYDSYKEEVENTPQSEKEDSETKKEKIRKKNKHRTKKDKLATDGMFGAIRMDSVDSGRMVTLYPELIKKDRAVFKAHSTESASQNPTYRSKKRHEKNHKNHRASKGKSTKKVKNEKHHLRSGYTFMNIERQGDNEDLSTNTERVKTKKHKTKNRGSRTHKKNKKKKEIYDDALDSNENKPKDKKASLRSKKRATKKSKSDDGGRGVRATFRNNGKDGKADTSSSNSYPNNMRFRNMDVESNEGMSIEEFHVTPGFYYRKSNSNNTFINIENKEKDKQARVVDKGLIKRIDNLEKQLKDVKFKIENQREYVPKASRLKSDDSNESHSIIINSDIYSDSDNSTETDTVTTKSANTTKSTKPKITKENPTSNISINNFKPAVKDSASTIFKPTNVTKDSTTVTAAQIAIETRKDKPKVVMKKTSDDFVIPKSENLLNTTVPIFRSEDNKNISETIMKETTKENKSEDTNLRKTGVLLKANVDNLNYVNTESTQQKFLSKDELHQAIFNDSTVLHEDKEKHKLMQKTIDEDLNKIFGEMPDGKIDLRLPNFDATLNSTKSRRRNMGSGFGKEMGDSFVPTLDLTAMKDPFSGDFDAI